MEAKASEKEKDLIDEAISWLKRRLPEGWDVGKQEVPNPDPRLPREDSRITLNGPHGSGTTIAIEAKQSVSPRFVQSLLLPRLHTARNMGGVHPLVVVAPWLSRKTQSLLAENGIGYIDLTGNARVIATNPPFYLETVGAERNPAPKGQSKAQLRGPKAARLIRLLTDVSPPYRLGELADAAALAPAYVSRMLDTLYDETLVERDPRGPIEAVDIAGLIRRWARSYDVLESNRTESFIATVGVKAVTEELANRPSDKPRFAITGSAAAIRLAPITAPALLLAYCDDPKSLADDLGLLPAAEGANVILLEPFDDVVWRRNASQSGLRFAAPAQIAVDCLTGTGRMPEEGEAVLDWMTENEAAWRQPVLPDFEFEGQ